MMNKGILYKIFIIPLLLIPLVCPFHIFADTVIVPTYSSNTVQTEFQNMGGTVQNYCESPLSGGTPCKLTFTFNDAYYGIIYFDAIFGSNSSQTYQTVYVVNGVGEWNYRTITSSPYQVTAVKIQILNVSKNAEDVSFMYEFPYESYGYIDLFNNRYSDRLLGIFGNDRYKFPMFQMNANEMVGKYWLSGGRHHYWIFYSSRNIYDIDRINLFFSFSGATIEIQNVKNIGYNVATAAYGACVVDIYAPSSGMMEIYTRDIMNFMPIYLAVEYYPKSTEFCETFGLSSDLMNDIHQIAQGTNNSNISASNLETVSDDISSSSDDLIQSEDSFNNSMNSNLQQIDTNINIGNLGNKFLASAEWVRVQFNTLTNGTPFGSVLSFSLLLGLALVLVGRIRK